MNIIDDFLNKRQNINQILTKVLIKIILDEIKNMIWYVHYKYPDKLKKRDVKDYIKKYSNILIVQYSETRKNKIKKNIQKKLLKRKPKSVYNIDFLKTKNKDNTKYNKNDKYCNARVWNYGSIIKLKDKTIYGGRCCRKKENNKEYCFQHSKNLKHGDYFKEPSETLQKHFEKHFNIKS